MNLRMLLLLILISSAHAQEEITEGQIALDGHVEISGQVVLTGYATFESLYYMPFLNGTQYTFDNNTNQLYAVSDMLTSKKADTWSLNFSLDGYYSDYSMTFYLPKGSQIRRFEASPELHYIFEVKDDSLVMFIQGFRVDSPWVELDYKLSNVESQSNVLTTYKYPAILLIVVLIAGTIFAFYRYRVQKKEAFSEKEELQESKAIPETKEIRITSGTQKVLDTLSDNEKAIVGILLRNGGSVTQATIRYETGIPKSSLTGIINTLKRKNIIKKREYGRTNLIELSEGFLSENQV